MMSCSHKKCHYIEWACFRNDENVCCGYTSGIANLSDSNEYSRKIELNVP